MSKSLYMSVSQCEGPVGFCFVSEMTNDPVASSHFPCCPQANGLFFSSAVVGYAMFVYF